MSLLRHFSCVVPRGVVRRLFRWAFSHGTVRRSDERMRGSSGPVAVGAVAGVEVAVSARNVRLRSAACIRTVRGAGWHPVARSNPPAGAEGWRGQGGAGPIGFRIPLGRGRGARSRPSGTRAVGSAGRRESAAALPSFGMIRAPAGGESVQPAQASPGSEGKVAPVATSVRGAVKWSGGGSPATHSVWKGGDKPLHPL